MQQHDGPRLYHTKWSQTEKDTIIWYHLFEESKNNTNELIYKIKIELQYDPAVPLLDIYSEKIILQKDTYTSIFIAALFTVAKTWKQPKCPLTDEWRKK